MAKAVKGYVGQDSSGTKVRYAVSESGASFVSYFIYIDHLGFKSWTKWEEYKKLEPITQIVNKYTGEIEEIENPNQLHYGFSTLTQLEHKLKWRLPY